MLVLLADIEPLLHLSTIIYKVTHPESFHAWLLMQAGALCVQVMAVLDAMPSSNLRPEDDSEVEANRVYRTTYMFSATMPPSVERLARKCAAHCSALGFYGAKGVSRTIFMFSAATMPPSVERLARKCGPMAALRFCFSVLERFLPRGALRFCRARYLQSGRNVARLSHPSQQFLM